MSQTGGTTTVKASTAGDEPGLEVSIPVHRFAPKGKPVLQDVHLSVPSGCFTTIVGSSGAGKTTVLRIIAGLLRPTQGTVLSNSGVIRGPGRDRALVFQEHNLLPWLTVQENVEWGAKQLRIPARERTKRASQLLEDVELSDFARAYPDQLSGGMRQRVGVARALCVDPEILLLDEPFSAVDAQTRSQLQRLLLRLWEGMQKTVLLVTHDIDEAIFLSDYIVVLSGQPGMIQDEIRIDFPRPRAGMEEDLRRQEQWQSYRDRIWAAVRLDPQAQ